MSDGHVVGTDQIIGSLSHLSQGLEDILTNARKYVTESTETFVTEKVDVLAGAIELYSNCYKSLNVTTKDDSEKLISRHFRNAEIQDGFEDLVTVEKDWDVFLEDVDRTLAARGTDTLMRVGDQGPTDVSLVDVRSDAAVTLGHYAGAGPLLETIAELGARVLVLSYGMSCGCRRWLDDQACVLDMAIDKERTIYHAMGLRRPLAKVWSIATITGYAEKLTADQPMTDVHEAMADDPEQLGGDLIVDSDGRVIFLYTSKWGSDRPDIAALLDVLREQKK